MRRLPLGNCSIPDRSYSRLRSGLQLVDRRGVADEEELSEFGAAIERSCRVGRSSLRPFPTRRPHCQGKGTRSLLRRGRHPGCRPYHERYRAAHGGSARRLAEAAGFRLDEPDGKFRLRDEAGRVICALANFEPTPLNVDGLSALSTRGSNARARCPAGPHGAFARFRDSARMFARS